jgi:hypothetical protein
MSSALSLKSYWNWNNNYKEILLFVAWDMVFCINIPIYSTQNFKEIIIPSITKLKFTEVTENKIRIADFNHIQELYHYTSISM